MPERPNLFYRLLLIVSFAFVVTALAYAVLPWKGQPEWLRRHGWQILLAELAGIILFGLLSMILDRRKAEDREQRSEVRGQRSDIGNRKSEQPLGDSDKPR